MEDVWSKLYACVHIYGLKPMTSTKWRYISDAVNADAWVRTSSSVYRCVEKGPGPSLSLFDWAICIAPVVCHYFTLISGSMKMHASLSKKTGGVATCHEIHKQAYVKLGMLHILNSNPPSHFIVGLIC